MQGEPLVTVADTSALEVVADFLSSDAVRIQPGMRALIDQWGGAQPLAAVVRRVEPAGFLKVSALGVEEQRVWVVLDLTEPASAARALGDGYRVEARVVTWEGRDVTRVPVSSLFRRGAGWAVFVEEGGRGARALRAARPSQRDLRRGPLRGGGRREGHHLPARQRVGRHAHRRTIGVGRSPRDYRSELHFLDRAGDLPTCVAATISTPMEDAAAALAILLSGLVVLPLAVFLPAAPQRLPGRRSTRPPRSGCRTR